MATIDFEDAFLGVPICAMHCQFLKFKWNGQIYMYILLPFGLAAAPRKFTRLLKPVLAWL